MKTKKKQIEENINNNNNLHIYKDLNNEIDNRKKALSLQKSAFQKIINDLN